MSEQTEEMRGQLAALRARLAELEERVSFLESRPASPGSDRVGNSPAPLVGPAGSGPDRETLAATISQILTQLTEADAGLLRQQLIKSGLVAEISRSDINKVLYFYKDRFEVARQEGAKPMWRLVG